MNFNYGKLKEIRKAKGYTQLEMAEKIGIARTTYADYEKGRILPPLDKIKRICELFNLQIEDIMPINSDMQLRYKHHSTADEIRRVMGGVQFLDITESEKAMLLSALNCVAEKYEAKND